ncbi:GntR family transcriptional regulator [Azospirillum ramasamyi]|nr:GntR family transcriptional regulator [Azospirillum ramasamyi]
MPNTIVRAADLRDQVYHVLKGRIIDGHYPQSAKFFEISLAQELGVSRTPVREALAMLVRDGLLVQMARGFCFPQFTVAQLNEIVEIRTLLEPYAIHTLVSRNSAEDMARLGRELRAMLEAAGPTKAYPDAHRRAREHLFSHVTNRQLFEAIERYNDSIHYIRQSTLGSERVRRISYEGMLRLSDAIAEGDADLARDLMVQQLINTREAFLEHLETREDGTVRNKSVRNKGA